MKIAIGCDEMGYELKQTLITRLKEKNIEFTDFGSFEDEKVLYPSIAEKVALEVKNNDYDRGDSHLRYRYWNGHYSKQNSRDSSSTNS